MAVLMCSIKDLLNIVLSVKKASVIQVSYIKLSTLCGPTEAQIEAASVAPRVVHVAFRMR